MKINDWEMTKKEVGQKAEDLACEYLVKKGFKILERNCELYCGEIDIVAKKKWYLFNKTLHFIEVKSLVSPFSYFLPEDKFNYKKQEKYKKLIESWLDKNGYSQDYPCQADLIAISFYPGRIEINFFENVLKVDKAFFYDKI